MVKIKGSMVQIIQGFKWLKGSIGSKFHMVDYIVSNKFIFDAGWLLYVLIGLNCLYGLTSVE